ncbi:MAG: hypothetical protein AB7P12_05035 [Alphaproteobacteria bacterium]
MSTITFDEYRILVLLKLRAEARNSNSSGRIDASDEDFRRPLNISPSYLGTILSNLHSEDFVSMRQINNTSYFNITRKGDEYIENFFDDDNSIVMKFMKGGDEWLASFTKSSNLEMPNPDDKVPAADRVITRRDNQEAWDQAVEALDNVIAEADRTNDFDGLTEPEVAHFKQVLKTGRQLFEQAAIKWAIVATTLLPTLMFFASAHPDFTLGVLAGICANAISKLFGQ